MDTLDIVLWDAGSDGNEDSIVSMSTAACSSWTRLPAPGDSPDSGRRRALATPPGPNHFPELDGALPGLLRVEGRAVPAVCAPTFLAESLGVEVRSQCARGARPPARPPAG